MISESFTAKFKLDAPDDGNHGSAHNRAKQLVQEAFETRDWGLSSHLNSIDGSRVVDDSGDTWDVEVDFIIRFEGSPSEVKEEFVDEVYVCKEVKVN